MLKCRYVDAIPFEQTYRTLPERFYSEESPRAASQPKFIAYNEPLAPALDYLPAGTPLPKGSPSSLAVHNCRHLPRSLCFMRDISSDNSTQP